MPSQYMDRGIIKWAPFSALDGYSSMLHEMKHRIKKQEKPILSDDEYELLNRNIQSAIIDNLEVEVQYFDQGYMKRSYGRIKKLDYVYKCLILTTEERIPALDVLSLEILD